MSQPEGQCHSGTSYASQMIWMEDRIKELEDKLYTTQQYAEEQRLLASERAAHARWDKFWQDKYMEARLFGDYLWSLWQRDVDPSGIRSDVQPPPWRKKDGEV